MEWCVHHCGLWEAVCLQGNKAWLFSPFVISSPWLSCANRAEREGEDSSFLPSFSKSGGGPGGGGGGGGGGRPGPGARAHSVVAVGATGPCGREKTESTALRRVLAERWGFANISQPMSPVRDWGARLTKGTQEVHLYIVVLFGTTWDPEWIRLENVERDSAAQTCQ